MPPIPVPPVGPLTPGPPLPLPTGTTPIEGGPSTSMAGWNHFQRTIATGLPTALHRVNVVQRATLRELARSRRVQR